MLKSVWFALIALLFLSGCSSINLRSNKEVAYKQKLERVLISSNLKAARYSYRYEPVVKLLSDDFTKRYLTTDTLDYRWADKPDTESLQASIASFKPSHVMEIVLTKYSYSHSSGSSSDSYDFKINVVDIALKKIVWKSTVNVSYLSPFGIFGATADEFANKVIASLEQDGLLVPEVVKLKEGTVAKAIQ